MSGVRVLTNRVLARIKGRPTKVEMARPYVVRADLPPAVAANPLIAFTTVATESGELVFQWIGDRGYSAMHTARITVD